MEELNETVVAGANRQIAIPQRLRKELAIKPNTKLCVYRKDNKLVVVKLSVPPLADLKESFQRNRRTNKGKRGQPKKSC